MFYSDTATAENANERTTIKNNAKQNAIIKVQSNKRSIWLRSASTEEALVINKKLQLKNIPDTIGNDKIKNYIPSFL
ncbi:MAG: hypothetical protein IPO64_17005 [Bacteroidetes bacterium]|nr:hypothetical protein [Bacteroidota bacterium]